MTDLTHIPDISEFQSGGKIKEQAVIVRVHNGTRPDHSWADFARQARGRIPVFGMYGYVIAGRDPAVQGRETAALIGPLRPGEFVACDLEEGSGDQTARAEAWCQAVDAACGGTAWVYSGLAFYSEHLSGVRRHRWVAAYGQGEPRGPHVLWQHTDSERHPGLGRTDCSIWHGTVGSLRQFVDASRHRTPTPNPAGHSEEVRMLVKFQSNPAVYEVCGSVLFHVTAQAWKARGLHTADVHNLPDNHPLAALTRKEN